MRISLYLPVYAPVAYAGQTPVAYKRALRDKFERVLVEKAECIISHAADRLEFDAERGEIHRRAHTRYDFDPNGNAAWATIIQSALDIFGLQKVLCLTGSTRWDMLNADDAASIGMGILPWAKE